MNEKMTLDQIRAFWTEQALLHGQSPSASWSDQRVIEMEIRELLKYLNDGDRVLDVGCANGYSTVQLASQKRISIRGLDYIPQMIEQARSRLAALITQQGGDLANRIAFDTGDITTLKEPSATYDKVVVIRVVINLGEWANQLNALRECARVLKPGGLLLLSEATVQGWQRLNQFRREWGLTDIPMPAFNNYLDHKQVVEALAGELELQTISDFASSYYVGTRVIKPLLARALGGDLDVANPAMEWNQWVSQLPAAGDYGTQKLLVFKKR